MTLEITESALKHDVTAGSTTVERLHAMSVGLHLDEFGTGYSSLEYLHSSGASKPSARSAAGAGKESGL